MAMLKVRQRFYNHEDFMLELQSHQGAVRKVFNFWKIIWQCWLWSLDRFTKNFFWKFKKWIVNSMEDYQTKHVRIFFWSQMSLLHKVLDPPSYTRDLQRAKFWNSILGHNFWMEGPMDLNSTPLSYIFNALFRDTPLAHLLLRHVCHICHICHVTCVTYVTCKMLRKVGKWDIPEKSIKNVAQRRWI